MQRIFLGAHYSIIKYLLRRNIVQLPTMKWTLMSDKQKRNMKRKFYLKINVINKNILAGFRMKKNAFIT